MSEFETAVLALLRKTKTGDVMTYGEGAAEAGFPGAARAVGNLLRSSEDVPWWRVVAANGRLHPHGAARQAELLASEGVPTANGFLEDA